MHLIGVTSSCETLAYSIDSILFSPCTFSSCLLAVMSLMRKILHS